MYNTFDDIVFLKNERYIYIILISVWFMYLYDKRVGLIVSIMSFFAGLILYYTDKYAALTMLKIYIIIIPSIFLFATLCKYLEPKYMNYIITWIMRLNIGGLIFSISNLSLQLLLLISAITTPYFTINQNRTIVATKSFVSVNLWIIISTLTLVLYYSINNNFSEHKYITIFK